jgi:hypothetical protein
VENQVWLYERLEGGSDAGQVRLALFREPGTGRVRKAIVSFRTTSHPSGVWSDVLLEHGPHLGNGAPS